MAAVAVAGLALFVQGNAGAATTTVDCTADPGALAVALGSASDGDTLAILGTCKGNFEIAHNLTLVGSGGATLDGQLAGTVITIDPAKTVAIEGLTITGGSGLFSGGGVVNNGGALTLTNSQLTGNSGDFGGGIFNNFGSATLTNTAVSGNSAGLDGGGIANGGTLTLTDSTISGNTVTLAVCACSDGGGGGIDNIGTLTVSSSTVAGNTSRIGGGIAIHSGSSATVSNSTVSGNSSGSGGGINSVLGTLTVTNSTVSGNTSGFHGGGIYSVGTLTVTNSTISANTALDGAGLWTDVPATLMNTIVAEQTSGANCGGHFLIADGGYNLEDGTSCGFSVANHSLPNTSPSFDPAGLQDNGGATKSIALVQGSAAIDAIPAGANGCGTTVTTDQRGVTRPQGAGCDIGSFELAVLSLSVAIDIKPGGLPNPVNLSSKGTIPVAILSDARFSAPTEVDTTSLKFGRTGNESSLAFCSAPQDVNGDGLLDLPCHFSTQKAGFQAGDTQGVLTGKTLTGTPITGTDSIVTVPSK